MIHIAQPETQTRRLFSKTISLFCLLIPSAVSTVETPSPACQDKDKAYLGELPEKILHGLGSQ